MSFNTTNFIYCLTRTINYNYHVLSNKKIFRESFDVGIDVYWRQDNTKKIHILLKVSTKSHTKSNESVII